MTWTKFIAVAVVFVAIVVPLSSPSLDTLSPSASVLSVQWTERNAIVINDDTRFTAENGVVSGSGTKLDPYIIEGWKIGQFENGTAIDIRNTDSHFRIRNVYTYSCAIGVQMNYVHNGWVEDSQFIDNDVGVAFFKSGDCKVLRSTIQGSDVALLISFSEVSQSDNTFINNNVDVQRTTREMPWELTWVGTVVCAAILIPLSAILVILIYFRVKRQRPPQKY
jgi:nitrous oxidase accessory protein NosD